MSQAQPLLVRMMNTNIVIQILIGIIAGVALATLAPDLAISAGLFGELFVSALKAVAPILVFILVAASIANQKRGQNSNMKPVIVLYLVGTFCASLTAVVMSFLFPTTLTLVIDAATNTAPEGIVEVINTLLFKIIDNPINALMTGNFIGILGWAVALGLGLHSASDATKKSLLIYQTVSLQS